MKKQNNNGKVSITYPFPEEITIKPGITLKISVSDDFPKDKVVTLDIKTKCVVIHKNGHEILVDLLKICCVLRRALTWSGEFGKLYTWKKPNLRLF